MNNGKKFVWICSIMAAAGIVLCIIGYASGGNVRSISVGSRGIRVNTAYGEDEREAGYKTETAKLGEFTEIDTDVNFGDITVEASDYFGISYNVSASDKFNYEMKNGCLTITKKNTGNNEFTFFSVGFSEELGKNDEYIRIYVPEGTSLDKAAISNRNGSISLSGFSADIFTVENDFGDVVMERVGSDSAEVTMKNGSLEILEFGNGDLSIINDFGKMRLNRICAGKLDITMENGGLDIRDAKSDTLTVHNDFGKTELEDVSVRKLADISTSNGPVVMTRAAAENVQVFSDFGSVTGDSLEAGSGTFELKNGKCRLKGLNINDLEITSDFGAVELVLVNPLEQYSYELDTEFGTITIGEKDMKESYHSLEHIGNQIRVNSKNGDIDIK